MPGNVSLKIIFYECARVRAMKSSDIDCHKSIVAVLAPAPPERQTCKFPDGIDYHIYTQTLAQRALIPGSSKALATFASYV
ncbi:hypothetical protein TgHK011_005524 [Trichoderma gracile]|nr:hypothetical protein TgHK011_005524 [Trichoderma gracile]